MTIKDIENIIRQKEGYLIDFKESVSKSLSNTLVAFANASGGKVFVGIDNDDNLKSFPITNKLLSDIETMARNCDPRVDISIENVEDKVLVINVPEGVNKPYRSKEGFYLRSGANSQKLKTLEIVDFIKSEGHIKFDELVRKDVDFESAYSQSATVAYLQDAIKSEGVYDPIETIQNLGAAKEIDGKHYFTNTGILFFTDNPTDYIPQAVVTCVAYRSTDKADIMDSSRFKSDVISNIEHAMTFVERHINVAAKIEDVKRVDVWEVPKVALREAIINAVVHRDYHEKGANVEIEVFADRVEISNPGGLPKGLTDKNFGKRSLTRNSLIADLLLRADYIEKLGTGINRIASSLARAGLPKATYDFNTFFTVAFSRSSYHKVSTEMGVAQMGEAQLGGLNDGLNGGLNGGLNNALKDVLEVIEHNPGVKANQISVVLDRSINTLDKQIARLIKGEYIERKGGKKTGGYYLKQKG